MSAMDRRSFLLSSTRPRACGWGAGHAPPTLSLGRAALVPKWSLRCGATWASSPRGAGRWRWLVCDEAVVVIDSQFADSSKAVPRRPQVPHVAPRIDLLLNTHHHPDHTGGNKVPAGRRSRRSWRTGTRRACSARRRPSHAAERAGLRRRDVRADVEGQRRGRDGVRQTHYGPGHTGGDAVYLLERANVVHMGDLMYHQRHPGADRAAGASALRNWIVSPRAGREGPRP